MEWRRWGVVVAFRKEVRVRVVNVARRRGAIFSSLGLWCANGKVLLGFGCFGKR